MTISADDSVVQDATTVELYYDTYRAEFNSVVELNIESVPVFAPARGSTGLY